MNVHILCPFYRKHLFRTLLHYYSSMNIVFHPICDYVDIEQFEGNTLPWVKPMLCPPLKKDHAGLPVEQCYKKFNDFIDVGDIVDSDYYGFVCDDDMYEQGFTDLLKQQTADIVYNSGYRGDKIPDDGSCPHPAWPLIISGRKDVRTSNIGLGMFSVRGRVLKRTRFNTVTCIGDGLYAESLLTMGSLSFVPRGFILKNFFQPGRYTDATKFPKPTWKMPVIL